MVDIRNSVVTLLRIPQTQKASLFLPVATVINYDRRAFTNSTVNTEQLLADRPDALFTERRVTSCR